MQVKKQAWLTVISESIAMKLSKRENLDHLEYLKIKLGLEVLLINLMKGSVVYGISIITGTFWPTFITHLSYFSLRRTAFGLHAKSSFVCSITSILLFNLIPVMLQGVEVSDVVLFLLSPLLVWLIYLYAPADTEKNPLTNAALRNKLRTQSVGTTILLLVIALLIPYPMPSVMIVLGVCWQVVSILPTTYKLLGRSYNNYEKFR